MKPHQKLTSLERDKIANWYAIGESIREIARKLERSLSSIWQFLRQNLSHKKSTPFKVCNERALRA